MIGAKYILPDGRNFRYTHAGGANLVVGNLNQAVVHTTNYSGEAIGNNPVGSRQLKGVDSTVGNIAISQFKFGYIYSDNTVAFPMMQIKDNLNIVTAGDADGLFDLFTPSPVATVSGTTTICYFENPWEDIIIHDSPNTAMNIGICKIALTTLYWGWVQTAGPCSAHYDSSTTPIAGIGDPVGPDQAVDGAVSGLATDDEDTVNIIGTALGLVEGDAEQTPIFLSID